MRDSEEPGVCFLSHNQVVRDIMHTPFYRVPEASATAASFHPIGPAATPMDQTFVTLAAVLMSDPSAPAPNPVTMPRGADVNQLREHIVDVYRRVIPPTAPDALRGTQGRSASARPGISMPKSRLPVVPRMFTTAAAAKAKT